MLLHRQRAYSIRTRIKTLEILPYKRQELIYVREHIPLEQGLRLYRFKIEYSLCTYVREHIPLEQGLRLCKVKNYQGFELRSESIFH